jgi:hypothetical protein
VHCRRGPGVRKFGLANQDSESQPEEHAAGRFMREWKVAIPGYTLQAPPSRTISNSGVCRAGQGRRAAATASPRGVPLSALACLVPPVEATSDVSWALRDPPAQLLCPAPFLYIFCICRPFLQPHSTKAPSSQVTLPATFPALLLLLPLPSLSL